jgi:hypothetical protein
MPKAFVATDALRLEAEVFSTKGLKVLCRACTNLTLFTKDQGGGKGVYYRRWRCVCCKATCSNTDYLSQAGLNYDVAVILAPSQAEVTSSEEPASTAKAQDSDSIDNFIESARQAAKTTKTSQNHKRYRDITSSPKSPLSSGKRVRLTSPGTPQPVNVPSSIQYSGEGLVDKLSKKARKRLNRRNRVKAIANAGKAPSPLL